MKSQLVTASPRRPILPDETQNVKLRKSELQVKNLTAQRNNACRLGLALAKLASELSRQAASAGVVGQTEVQAFIAGAEAQLQQLQQRKAVGRRSLNDGRRSRSASTATTLFSAAAASPRSSNVMSTNAAKNNANKTGDTKQNINTHSQVLDDWAALSPRSLQQRYNADPEKEHCVLLRDAVQLPSDAPSHDAAKPLVAPAGAVVEVAEKYPSGVWFGRVVHPPSARGAQGVFTPSLTQPLGRHRRQDTVIGHVIVRHAFAARDPSELSLVAGQEVELLALHDSLWWNGRDRNGHQGWFPATFVVMKDLRPLELRIWKDKLEEWGLLHTSSGFKKRLEDLSTPSLPSMRHPGAPYVPASSASPPGHHQSFIAAHLEAITGAVTTNRPRGKTLPNSLSSPMFGRRFSTSDAMTSSTAVSASSPPVPRAPVSSADNSNRPLSPERKGPMLSPDRRGPLLSPERKGPLLSPERASGSTTPTEIKSPVTAERKSTSNQPPPLPPKRRESMRASTNSLAPSLPLPVIHTTPELGSPTGSGKSSTSSLPAAKQSLTPPLIPPKASFGTEGKSVALLLSELPKPKRSSAVREDAAHSGSKESISLPASPTGLRRQIARAKTEDAPLAPSVSQKPQREFSATLLAELIADIASLNFDDEEEDGDDNIDDDDDDNNNNDDETERGEDEEEDDQSHVDDSTADERSATTEQDERSTEASVGRLTLPPEQFTNLMAALETFD